MITTVTSPVTTADEAMIFLLDKMAETKSNEDFLDNMNQ